jgi:2-polyprenyl-3-methyl-5-hydroxy-6-metoxy-1,4-benzoquinol methylase
LTDRQPTRSKRVREDRRFDKTQLRIGGHGRTVHRDYIGHWLRWNFVAQEMNKMGVPEYMDEIALRYGWVQRHVKQGMKVLDVGCGQDQPLLYILGARLNTVPELYVGCDLNRIAKKSNVRWAKIYDEFDFINRNGEIALTHGPFDIATSFEVIEHMEPADGLNLLKGIHACLKPGGVLYLSTPVFDGLAAANHIHEYLVPELKDVINAAGFTVAQRYGTFASKPQIRPALTPAERDVYDRLEKWYGGEVMSCLMAPLYPDASRNNMWLCVKA